MNIDPEYRASFWARSIPWPLAALVHDSLYFTAKAREWREREMSDTDRRLSL